MPATSIDPERGDAARDPFDAELQDLKRENRQHRQALDHVLAEIHSRMAESPRQRLAADLLLSIAGEQLAQEAINWNAEGTPEVRRPLWERLPEMAEKCLEAAGKIFPEPSQIGHGIDPNGFIDPGLEGDPEAAIKFLGLDHVAPPPPAAVEGAQAVAGGFAGEDNWGDEHRRAMAFYDAQDAGKEAE